MTTITLKKTILDALPMNSRNLYQDWYADYYEYMGLGSGTEHYRLLSSISRQLPDGSKIADLGTLYGSSAVALSENPNVLIDTYDTHRLFSNERQFPSNITYYQKSCQDAIEDISNALVVLLDIDPHDGEAELEFIGLLKQNGFKGLLICDDIKLNDEMKSFWSDIDNTLKKVDVSEYGHWSGTGIVVFDPSTIDIITL